MGVLTRVSHYVSKVYQIQDCEESEERARSTIKNTTMHYCALRAMTCGPAIREMIQWTGGGNCEDDLNMMMVNKQ